MSLSARLVAKTGGGTGDQFGQMQPPPPLLLDLLRKGTPSRVDFPLEL